jgi:dynein regulatory complex subunit 2
MHRRILQLSELSRKVETIEEQILPFVPSESTKSYPTDMFTSTDVSNPSAAKHQSMVASSQGHSVHPADRLIYFHRKLNKILLDNIAIGKEKERLEKENAQLEDLIAQYLDGTKVTESTVLSDNPLFVINGRLVSPFLCTTPKVLIPFGMCLELT